MIIDGGIKSPSIVVVEGFVDGAGDHSGFRVDGVFVISADAGRFEVRGDDACGDVGTGESGGGVPAVPPSCGTAVGRHPGRASGHRPCSRCRPGLMRPETSTGSG